MLAQFEAPVTEQSLAMADWWQRDWARQPARRNDFDDEQRWLLDVQVAGALAPLRAKLEAAGWRSQEQAGWEEALNLLDNDLPDAELPVLPATLDTRAESLLMLRAGVQPGETFVLRLWTAHTQLQPGASPLWIGSAQVLQRQRAFGLISVWRPLREADAALRAVTLATDELEHQLAPHPETDLPVLRIRTAPQAVPAPQ
jgi:hypothetical protein